MKSPVRLCAGDDVLNKDSLNSKAKRAEFLSHILQGTSESNKLIRSELRCLSIDYISIHLMCQPRARLAKVSLCDVSHGDHICYLTKLLSHGQLLDLLLCGLSHVAHCHGKSLRV